MIKTIHYSALLMVLCWSAGWTTAAAAKGNECLCYISVVGSGQYGVYRYAPLVKGAESCYDMDFVVDGIQLQCVPIGNILL